MYVQLISVYSRHAHKFVPRQFNNLRNDVGPCQKMATKNVAIMMIGTACYLCQPPILEHDHNIADTIAKAEKPWAQRL